MSQKTNSSKDFEKLPREKRPPLEEPYFDIRPSLEEPYSEIHPSLEKLPREKRPPLEEPYREIHPSLEKLPRERRPPNLFPWFESRQAQYFTHTHTHRLQYSADRGSATS